MFLISHIRTVSLWIMVSRCLGLIREILIAATLGASAASDAFFTAFKLPNTLRLIFAEGAVHSTFSPAYSKENHTSPKNAQIFAGKILSLIALTTTALSILAIVFMPQIMSVFAYGFLNNPAQFNLTVQLAQIVFPYIVFMALTSLMTSIDNTHRNFNLSSAAPSILNLSLISTLLAFSFNLIQFKLTAALCWTILIAGALQLALLTFSLAKKGLLPKPQWPFNDPKISKLLLIFLPVALAAGIQHINNISGHILATTLNNGAVSFLYYAERLLQLPVAIIGFSFATVLLPQIRHEINSSSEKYSPSTNIAFDTAMLISIPATCGLISLAPDIIHSVYQNGNFSSLQSMHTSNALIALSLGLPAIIAFKIISTLFFAHQNTKAIAITALSASFIYISSALILMPSFLHIGIALAASISAWINLFIISVIMHKKNYWKISKIILSRLALYLFAAIIMVLVLFLLSSIPLLNNHQNSFFEKFFFLALKIILGISVYIATLSSIISFCTPKLKPLCLSQQPKK
jgi:putative peptidoglycan lipid II flippase